MYTQSSAGKIRQDLIALGHRAISSNISPLNHADRVKMELRQLGVTKWGLMTSESQYLPKIIHQNEKLGAVIYGRHSDGFAMLVATDRRVIFLDKKPFFVNEDEITYDVISGVRFTHAGMGNTVTLHTRIKDYAIKTLNEQCAERFVEYIEATCLDRNYQQGATDDQFNKKWLL